MHRPSGIEFFFFFNDTATTEIYTLSLHDALPISKHQILRRSKKLGKRGFDRVLHTDAVAVPTTLQFRKGIDARSEEHTSELQSQSNLVCRLLLEKKKNSYTSPSPVHISSLPHTRT